MSDKQGARGRRSARASTKTPSGKAKRAEAKAQAHVCREPGCGRSFATARGLTSHERQAHPPAPVIESPTAAVERALRSITITPKLAVLAATVRELARALELCEPTDKAKTAKELTARMADLLGEGPPDPGKPDWTEGAEE